jgi:hypothetical protein
MITNCTVYYRAKQREEMFFAFSKGSRGCLGKKYVHHCYFPPYDKQTLTLGNPQSWDGGDEDPLTGSVLAMQYAHLGAHGWRHGDGGSNHFESPKGTNVQAYLRENRRFVVPGMKFGRNGFVASWMIFRGSYRTLRASRLFEDLICCSIVPEMRE